MGHKERQDDDDGSCPVLERLPKKLRDKLLPFQKEGVRFAVEKNGRYFFMFLIAGRNNLTDVVKLFATQRQNKMGLGKTLQAISVAYFYKDEWPMLIVVPSSLKFCWVEELEKWLPDLLPHEINLVHSGGDISGMSVCPITIITYGLLRLPSNNVMRETLAARKFQVVICDESHYLKNSNTLSCKTVVPLLKSAKRRILLSGTPALARPVELYSQIDAVCPGQFGSYWQYTNRYCDAHTVYFGKFKKRQVSGASNLAELQQKLQTMMIRREKCDVLTELPPKQRQRILFELKSSPLKRDILEMFAELKQKIRKGDGKIQSVFQPGLLMDELANLPQAASAAGDQSPSGMFQLISQLYRLSGEAKIGPVREYIEMLCEDEQLKFLVFAYHHNMMDGIQQTLSERKIKFVRIDGNTKSCDRQTYVNQFQSDPQTRVAILSILAAGVGLTLTAAKLVVFAELYWTPGVMLQCEDRAHRIGQTCSLPVHYLIARDTMDEWVWSSVCRKTLVTSTVLTGTSRQLEHGEGESYQVELLSNADVWKPEEDSSDVNVTQLIQSQRSHDQSSILEFFPSQGSPENTVTVKRKYRVVSQEEESRASTSAGEGCLSLRDRNQTIQQKSSDVTKRKRKLELKISAVITISDEEDEFQPVRKSKKTKSRWVKKRKEKNSKDGQTDIDGGRGFGFSEAVPNFNLNFFEDPVNAPETSCSGVEDGASVISGGGVENCVSEVLYDGGDDSDNSSSISDTSLFVASDRLLEEHRSNMTGVSSHIQVKNTQVKDAEFKDTTQVKDSQVKDSQVKEAEVKVSQVKDAEVKDTTQVKDVCSQFKGAEFKETQLNNSQFQDKNKIQYILFSDDTSYSDPQNPVDTSTQQSAASSPACDHSDGVQNSMSETYDGHFCLKGESKLKVDNTRCGEWPCSVCTFSNHPELPECEMCDTPKKKSAPKRHKHLTKGVNDANNKSVSLSKKHSVSGCSHVEVNCHDSTSQTADPAQTGACSQTSEGNDSPLQNRASQSKGRNKDSSLWTKTAGRNKHSNSLTDPSSDRLHHGERVFTAIKLKPDPACGSVSPGGCTLADIGDKKKHEGSIQTGSCVDTGTSDHQVDIVLTSQEHPLYVLKLRAVKDVSGYSSETSSLFGDPEDQLPNSDLKTVHNLSKFKHIKGRVPDSETVDSSLKFDSSRVTSQKSTFETDDLSERLNTLIDGDSATKIDSFSSTFLHSAAPNMGFKPELHASCVSAPGGRWSVSQCAQVLSVSPVGASPPSAEPAPGFDLQSITTTGGECSSSVTCDVENQGNTRPGDRVVHQVLKFCCSSHTGRIFAFDENEQFLQASFQPIDIELGNTDELPQVLQQFLHLRLLQKFVREWSSLTDTKKRLIAKRGQIFTSPLAAYDQMKTVHGSTQRHLNKQDKVEQALSNASKLRGAVRMISRKPPTQTGTGDLGQTGSGVRSLPQVVTDSGAPLCLQCQRPVSNPLLSAETISNPDNAWQLRLCSFTCMDKYWTLSKASYCREQLQQVERGVCQLCGFDAHALFTHIKITKSVTARADILMKSPYRTLTQTQRKKIIQEPQPGQFWHADHILPVWQGGGMCDLDNLRTLCTVCHLKVTSRQATQRATARKLGAAMGQADITAFFQRS